MCIQPLMRTKPTRVLIVVYLFIMDNKPHRVYCTVCGEPNKKVKEHAIINAVRIWMITYNAVNPRVVENLQLTILNKTGIRLDFSCTEECTSLPDLQWGEDKTKWMLKSKQGRSRSISYRKDDDRDCNSIDCGSNESRLFNRAVRPKQLCNKHKFAKDFSSVDRDVQNGVSEAELKLQSLPLSVNSIPCNSNKNILKAKQHKTKTSVRSDRNNGEKLSVETRVSTDFLLPRPNVEFTRQTDNSAETQGSDRFTETLLLNDNDANNNCSSSIPANEPARSSKHQNNENKCIRSDGIIELSSEDDTSPVNQPNQTRFPLKYQNEIPLFFSQDALQTKSETDRSEVETSRTNEDSTDGISVPDGATGGGSKNVNREPSQLAHENKPTFSGGPGKQKALDECDGGDRVTHGYENPKNGSVPRSSRVRKQAVDSHKRVSKAERKARETLNRFNISEEDVQTSASNLEELKEINRALKESKLCKVCRDKDANRLFLPCAHLACCALCSPAVTKCPQCRSSIRGVVSVYYG